MASPVEDQVRAEIADVCADVELIHRPTVMQYVMWKDMVNWDDGTDPDGWFLGICPIAHVDHKPPHMVQYNFHKGAVKCEEQCFTKSLGRRTASLTRVVEAIAVQALRTSPITHNG